MGHFRRRRDEKCPDRILRTVHVDVFVAGIGKSHELLGLVGESIKPLAECDRHYPVAPPCRNSSGAVTPAIRRSERNWSFIKSRTGKNRKACAAPTSAADVK